MRDWNELLQDNLVRREAITASEIREKMDGARHARSQADAVGLSPDYRFDILYDAAFKWCTIVIRAEGYRTAGYGHHETVFSAFRYFLGDRVEDLAMYLDSTRSRRHMLHYDWKPDIISPVEADELSESVDMLETTVLNWLNNSHPQFIFE